MLALLGRRRGSSVALTAGVIAASVTDDDEITVSEIAVPMGGHGTITVAIYRHTATFTPPGTGTLIGTSFPCVDGSRTADVEYFYEAIYTDTRFATANSNEVTATIVVDPPPPGEPDPDFEEGWEYANTAAMQADPNGWFGTDENTVSNTGVSSGTITLGTNALRLTFANRTSDPDHSSESQLGKTLDWTGEIGTVNEFWMRLPHRFMSGWKTDFTAEGGAKGQSDHKTLFLSHTAALDSDHQRWELKWGWGNAIRIQIETAQSDFNNVARVPKCTTSVKTGTIVNPYAGLFNGAWWSVFIHAKHETSIGANDGAYQVWIAGTPVFDFTNIGTGRTKVGGFTGLALGRNLNHIPCQSQWFEFGPVQVWLSDPGVRV